MNNNDNAIKIKYNFFREYWKDFLDNGGIETQLIHTVIYNPRVLFRDFADEIKRKKLLNQKNKFFFIESTKDFASLNIKALNFLRPILAQIKQQFSKKNDYTYLLYLLGIIDDKLDNFQFGTEAVKEIAEYLNDSSSFDPDKIKILVNIIIFELRQKKFSDKKISEIINMINNLYKSIHPDDIRQDEFYNIVDYLEGKETKNWLLGINFYFQQKPEKFRYIFQIEGLVGDINLNMGNIEIYNPLQKKLITSNSNSLIDETFGSKKHINELEHKSYCNASVEIDTIDVNYSLQEALSSLNDVLASLIFNIIKLEIPLLVKTDIYYIIDKDGKFVGATQVNTHEFINYLKSFEIKKSENLDFIQNYYNGKIYKSDISIIDIKIKESLIANKRAIESIDQNSKILWYWICLENLLGETEMVFKVLPKILARKNLYDFIHAHCKKLHYMLETITMNSHRFDLRSCQKSTLLFNEIESLTDFILAIDKMKDKCDENSLLYTQLIYLQNILTDKSECLKLFKKFEKIAHDKLLLSYRIRNKIIHHASNDTTSTIDYYAKFITVTSNYILNEFILKRDQKNLNSSEDIINNLVFDVDDLKWKINEYGSQILFELNDYKEQS